MSSIRVGEMLLLHSAQEAAEAVVPKYDAEVGQVAVMVVNVRAERTGIPEAFEVDGTMTAGDGVRWTMIGEEVQILEKNRMQIICCNIKYFFSDLS